MVTRYLHFFSSWVRDAGVTKLGQHYNDVIEWKHLSCYWPFVRGIHRSPVNSPQHKGQRLGALMISLICSWINGWVNTREAGHLRRHRAHYTVIATIGPGNGTTPSQHLIQCWHIVKWIFKIKFLWKWNCNQLIPILEYAFELFFCKMVAIWFWSQRVFMGPRSICLYPPPDISSFLIASCEVKRMLAWVEFIWSIKVNDVGQRANKSTHFSQKRAHSRVAQVTHMLEIDKNRYISYIEIIWLLMIYCWYTYVIRLIDICFKWQFMCHFFYRYRSTNSVKRTYELLHKAVDDPGVLGNKINVKSWWKFP